jgi:PhzF family phenazine biosynthesis protein
MSVPLWTVDAFTDEAFRGNPAAVCVLEEPRGAAWMQALAMEMNLSETAYVRRAADGWELRWFTPTQEVDLCGHATLASAHALWESGQLSPDEPARFHTKSGVLTGTREGDWIALDFPAVGHEAHEPFEAVERALGARPAESYRTDLRGNALLLFASKAELVAIEPNFRALAAGPSVIATSPGEGEIDFASRYFAPAAGIDEDPVTGSAHCVLAPFWSKRLGRDELRAFQASARGGVVRTRVQGDRVVLLGRAVTVLRGELTPAAALDHRER